MNFLEIYAAAINARPWWVWHDEIVEVKIVDSLVELTNAPQWHDDIEQSMRSSTYTHLRKFNRKRRSSIKFQADAASKPAGAV